MGFTLTPLRVENPRVKQVVTDNKTVEIITLIKYSIIVGSKIYLISPPQFAAHMGHR